MSESRLLDALNTKDEIQNIKRQLAQAQLDCLAAEAKLAEFEGFDLDEYPGLVAERNDAEVTLKRSQNRRRFWTEKLSISERVAGAEARLNGTASRSSSNAN